MFIKDGIVYGGEPEKPIKIEQVKVLPDMMMPVVSKLFLTPSVRTRFKAITKEKILFISRKY